MTDDLIDIGNIPTGHASSTTPHWSTGENLPGLRVAYPTLKNRELQETYASDLRYINNWCQIATLKALVWPAPVSLIRLFLRHHGVGGVMPNEIAAKLIKAGRHSPYASAITNRRRLATWKHAHRLMGIPDSFERAGASAFMAGTITPVAQMDEGAHPVTEEVIQRLLETSTMPVHDLRDRAIIRLSFGAGALSRTEIAHITVDELRLRLCADHADDELKSTSLEAWLHFASISEGPAFRVIGRGGNVLPNAMSKESVYNVLKRRLEVAGYPPAWASFRPRRAALSSLNVKVTATPSQPTLPKLSTSRTSLKR